MSKRPSARPKKRADRLPAASNVRLPAECTLSEVHDMKSKLAALLKTEGPLCVDVSAVQRVDTASLQLLAAFVRDRRASGLAVDLRGESAVFGEGVRLLGLHRLLDRAAVAPQV